jgi:hypothetical protein
VHDSAYGSDIESNIKANSGIASPTTNLQKNSQLFENTDTGNIALLFFFSLSSHYPCIV